MTENKKFDPKKLEKLNDPNRLKIIKPDLIWDALKLISAKTLIDIGAGTGVFASIFSNKPTVQKIYACDTSDEMIKWMQENLKDKKISAVKCAESSIKLPDAIADLVYMINVHHELIEPEKTLIESYRLLKPHGKIAIIDWKYEEMEQGPPLTIRIPSETIFGQLSKAGFSNIISHCILPLHSFITGQK